jgi:peptidoglycan/xylan/chitin deacetylase (PgdA/CDA1 family)
MLVLLYHNLLLFDPLSGTPVVEYQTPLAAFEEQVHRIRDQILHPLEVHDLLLKGQQPKGILLTFDDGAAGIVEAGQVLAAAGKQGVAFICPDACQNGLWFYRLADALVRTAAEKLIWQDVLLPLAEQGDKKAAYKALSPRLFDMVPAQRDIELARIIAQLEPLVDSTPAGLQVLDEVGLTRAAQTGGLIFANHSWSHANLSSLSPAIIHDEVERADVWLGQSGLPVLPWFALPRGRYTETTFQIVSKFHPVCFGANCHETIRQVIPRIEINRKDARPWRFATKTTWEGRFFKSLIKSTQTLRTSTG